MVAKSHIFLSLLGTFCRLEKSEMSTVIHDKTILKLEDELNKSSGMEKLIPLKTQAH